MRKKHELSPMCDEKMMTLLKMMTTLPIKKMMTTQKPISIILGNDTSLSWLLCIYSVYLPVFSSIDNAIIIYLQKKAQDLQLDTWHMTKYLHAIRINGLTMIKTFFALWDRLIKYYRRAPNKEGASKYTRSIQSALQGCTKKKNAMSQKANYLIPKQSIKSKKDGLDPSLPTLFPQKKKVLWKLSRILIPTAPHLGISIYFSPKKIKVSMKKCQSPHLSCISFPQTGEPTSRQRKRVKKPQSTIYS